ncbi:MDR family MFS transporter [Nocardiopsis algeriensis]|uniref:EmrB/QacA subfamily drug resistance transporter n=1 Tax=Nocardiopsis algeriensis TaxID=1478215 RepID=A0A841IN77_9ACTN|nr:MDR family MFS transporter [Nocardiopsis algeriensis]MBB6118175.1 EmrB/QacA subfamily drug resistance transporter [Nocardiopsis algeriensis]
MLRERREHRTGRIALVMTALLLTVLLSALDQTIVSTALPTIVSELGGLDHLSWVVTAYLLAVTASTPLWGKLGDQFGRKGLFLVCIAVFLLGSALCGLAQDMLQLILFRGLQGIGGGGLMVLASAIIGDVVSPRERGRYQGLFGAVFGLSSVAGPLLGGLFVDHLSWRWVFYVNLPLGAIAFATVLAVLPPSRPTGRRSIDYAGIALLAAAAVCLTLTASWGGSVYPWLSPQILGLSAATAAFGLGWWLSARRAADPVMPLSLFRNPVIVVAVSIGFCVGFAMMGSMAFLPLFLQVVHGLSPTASGLYLLPMVVGIFLTSIGSGRLVTRTGRYRPYPIAGMAVTSLGLLLLSRLGPDSSSWQMWGSFFVLGVGLGLVMQVVVLVVQNAAEYADLGVATSTATFFRSIGGSLGTAVFGAVFARGLAAELEARAEQVRLPPGLDAQSLESDPRGLDRLPPASQEPFLQAYADAVDTVFLSAVPLALIGLLLAVFLREIPLRTTVESDAGDTGETLPPVAAGGRSAIAQVERQIFRACGHEGAREMYDRLRDAAGLEISPRACWTLSHLAVTGPLTGEELARMARLPDDGWRRVHRELLEAGYLVGEDEPWELNWRGADAAGRVFDAQRTALRSLLGDYGPAEHPDVVAVLEKVTADTLGDESDAARMGRA